MRTALKAMMVKEMRQIVRDKRIIVVLIAAPMIQLLVFGHAVELELRELQLAVLDQDQSPQSRAFVEGVCAGDAFSRGDSLQSHTQIEPEIRSGRAHAVLVIPPGWSASLQRGESTTLQLLIDGTDMNRATFAQNALMAYSNTISIARIQAALPASALATRQGSLRIDTRILFNPSLNSKHYFV
ncbi:MAG: ABC transporter permease, partial [Myxococcota bacterium]|nr:ABC transporter permease [Myxococcota bacterium]